MDPIERTFLHDSDHVAAIQVISMKQLMCVVNVDEQISIVNKQ